MLSQAPAGTLGEHGAPLPERHAGPSGAPPHGWVMSLCRLVGEERFFRAVFSRPRQPHPHPVVPAPENRQACPAPDDRAPTSGSYPVPDDRMFRSGAQVGPAVQAVCAHLRGEPEKGRSGPCAGNETWVLELDFDEVLRDALAGGGPGPLILPAPAAHPAVHVCGLAGETPAR
ncbi:hypothetical protein [Sphaerisporangium corydalis]